MVTEFCLLIFPAGHSVQETEAMFEYFPAPQIAQVLQAEGHSSPSSSP
jgi:hypothetical protein